MVVEKIPRWESELWSYISNGDGEHCPFYSQCRTKPLCHWCADDNKELLGQLVYGEQFNTSDPNFTEIVSEGEGLSREFQLVEKLAQSYLKIGKVRSPPVPVGLVALCDQRCAIEVREVPLNVYHSAVWGLRDRWVIHLNANESASKKRYSLFHEAFHILAHCKTTPVFRSRGSLLQGSFNELIADYFAFCILMPRGWVKEKWAEVHDLNRMAKIFDVPEIAMALRLRQLDLI